MTPHRTAAPIAAALAACLAAPSAAQEGPLFDDSRDFDPSQLAGAFSCPFDVLASLYASLAPDELPGVMAAEAEVLLICADRQAKLREIMRAELDLREAMGIPDPGPAAPRVSVSDASASLLYALEPPSCPEPQTAAAPPPQPPRPPPAPPVRGPRAAPLREAGEPSAFALAAAAALSVLAERAPAAEAQENCAAPADWTWDWTVRDSSGRQIARLTGPDGESAEVAQGDILPDGSSVTRITGAGVFLSAGGGSAPIARSPASAPPRPGTDSGTGTPAPSPPEEAGERNAGPPAASPPEEAGERNAGPPAASASPAPSAGRAGVRRDAAGNIVPLDPDAPRLPPDLARRLADLPPPPQ